MWDLLFPKGLAKRVYDVDGRMDYKLTVAGVLLLAKQPTAFLPGARIRFVRYEGYEANTGVDMNVVKQVLLEGPLTTILEQMVTLLEGQLRSFMRLDSRTGRFSEAPEYPKGAWLEGLVNAVAHRSYNYSGDDIRVLMFDDHLEIHSPGGLPAMVTTDNIRHTHYSRNPYIARALTDSGWVREFGEGVERIYRDMDDFFLDDPLYKVDANSVNLILKNNIVMRSVRKSAAMEARIGSDWQSLNYIEQIAINLAFEHGSIRTKELAASADGVSLTAARNALGHLVTMQILERVATSPTAPNLYYRLTQSN